MTSVLLMISPMGKKRKNFLTTLAILTGLISVSRSSADTGYNVPNVLVSETDGNPRRRPVQELEFSTGTVTISGTKATIITGGGSGGGMTSGSTFYIQNTLSPTTTTQSFSVQQGQISGVSSSTTSFQVKDGNGNPVLWTDTTVALSTQSAYSVIASTSLGFGLTVSTTIGSGYQLKVSTTGAVSLFGSGVAPDSFALCFLNGALGHCTTVVGAGGGCTCSVP